jgi:hypothetical protein
MSALIAGADGLETLLMMGMGGIGKNRKRLPKHRLYGCNGNPMLLAFPAVACVPIKPRISSPAT